MSTTTVALLVLSHAGVMLAFLLWSAIRTFMDLFDDEARRGRALLRLVSMNGLVLLTLALPVALLLVTYAPRGHDPTAIPDAAPLAIFASLALVAGALLLYIQQARRDLSPGRFIVSLGIGVSLLALLLTLLEVGIGSLLIYVRQTRIVFAGQSDSWGGAFLQALAVAVDPRQPGAALTWFSILLFFAGLATSRLRRFLPLLVAQATLIALLTSIGVYFQVLVQTQTAHSVRESGLEPDLGLYLLSASQFSLVFTTTLVLLLLVVSAVRLYEVRTLEAISLMRGLEAEFAAAREEAPAPESPRP